MNKQTFYQNDSKGNTREWNIEVIDNGTSATIRINAGIKDGKMIPTDTIITVGKGSKTYLEQAIADAQTEINTKVKKGYVTDLTQVKSKGETATIKAPMKGDKYHPTGKNKGLTLDKLGIRNKKVGIQRKLDGWRFRVHITKNDMTYYTSSGDETLEFPQISASLRKSFDKIFDYVNSKYGVTEYYLDGELYRHGLQVIRDAKDKITGMYFENNTSGFSAAASAGGSGKNKTTQSDLTPIQKELRDKMEFHLFDVCLDAPYTTRAKVLEYFYSETVQKVDTFEIIAEEKVIEAYFNQFLKEGYEGLMIRQLDMPYEYKRTKQLTKYKPLCDEEFEIVGFKKSIAGDTLGSLECIMDNGKKFFTNLKDEIGTDAMKQQIWDNQSNYLGKFVTVEYLELTEDEGVPRLPRAKCFRKQKSMD